MMNASHKRAFILPVLLSLTISFSASAFAISNTEVQLDKLSPQQLEQAAEAGDPDAQYALGYMYYYGNGVPQDAQQAVDWIKRASVQGQEQAIKALALIDPSSALVETPATQSRPTPTPTPVSTQVVSAAANVDASPAPATENLKSADSAASSVNTALTETKPVQAPVTSSSEVMLNNKADHVTVPSAKNVLHVSDSLAEEEKHLLNLPDSYYTVQVLGSYNEQDVKTFIEKYKLKGKVAYYRGDNDGKDWYVVLYGVYQSPSEAKSAIIKLPEGVQKQKPWVKPMRLVHEGIKQKSA